MSNVDYISTVGAADQVAYTHNTELEKTGDTRANEGQFAQVLSDTVKDLTSNMLTNTVNNIASPGAGIGAPGSLPAFGMGNSAMNINNPMYGMGIPMPAMDSTIEQAISNASFTGDKNDVMMALLMMMMMMQSGDGGGEMPMMMQLMAAMISQAQEKDAIYKDFVQTPDISPNVLDTIDNQVFGAPQPEEGLSGSYLPLQWWKPAVTRTVSDVYDRSPERYRMVLDELEVETAERYRPGREGHTYCNVYVWDATRAMGAEIPYYTNSATGAPREYPDIQGASYNGAIAMDRWLKTHGGSYGWRQVSAEEAQIHANTGKPAVASGADIGHISMIAPSNGELFDPAKGVVVAQAGRTVTNYMHISGIYGAMALRDKVTYWIHD